MLRYYDEIGLLHPAQTDTWSGYRLYSIEQIPTLQKIVLLRDVKFSVAEIAVALEKWDNAFLMNELEHKKKEIQHEIFLEEQRVHQLEMAISAIKQKNMAMHYNVSFKSIPSFHIVSLRKVIPNYQCEGMLWSALYRFIKEEHLEILHQSNNNIAMYHDEGHKDENVDIEVGIMVKKLGKNKDGFTFREVELVETMACMMVYGPYEKLAHAYQSFAYWLEQHREYKMVGVSRPICHKGPYDEEDSNQYVTEIQTPVIKKI